MRIWWWCSNGGRALIGPHPSAKNAYGWGTRLTNAHSKKLANHEAAIALHYMHYNYCRIHSTLRVTPAMEAGLAHHVWSIEELVGLLK
jgi:hypothetical protein